MPGDLIAVGLAVGVAAVGAGIDARTGHIPNWLTGSALCAAPLIWLLLGYREGGASGALSAAGVSLLGALLCGFGPMVAYLGGGLGGGDVKLLAALGALLGPRLGLDAEFFGFVIGALYVPGRLAWRGKLLATLWGAMKMLKNPFVKKEHRAAAPEELKMRVRLGPAILMGTVLVLALGRSGV